MSKHRCTCASSRLRSSTPTSTSSTSWRARIPVARLSAATGGDLSRSTRHHTLYAPNGYGDELRAVLRTGAVVWGHVCLSRSEDGPAFGAAEADVVHRLSGHVAHGLRVGHLLTAAASDDAGPGVVVLDDAAQVMSATEQARELLAPVPTGGLELPLAVYEVAQQARAVAEGAVPGPPPVVRLLVPDERWLVLHGSRLGEDRSVVVVEPARPSELAPVVVAAHGLTPREREVTELWVRGLDVAAVATTLFISPHTVHDHVRAVYAKMSVRSRPELVAALVATTPFRVATNGEEVDMGLGDMAKKAKQALSSDKGEQLSDQALDRGADLANRVTGGKYADKVEAARDAADERVGNEGAGGDRPSGRRRADTEVDAGGSEHPRGKHRA